MIFFEPLTFTLRALHHWQPFLDFVCARRGPMLTFDGTEPVQAEVAIWIIRER